MNKALKETSLYGKNHTYAFHVTGKKGKERWKKRPELYFYQSIKKDGFQIFSEPRDFEQLLNDIRPRANALQSQTIYKNKPYFQDMQQSFKLGF